MLTGFEDESLEDLDRQLAWLKRRRPDTSVWSTVMMYPGTLLYNQRGGRFFETGDWTEQAVGDFYRNAVLSPVPPGERSRWWDTRLRPWLRRISVISHLRNNGPGFWMEAALREPARKVRGVARHLSLVMSRGR
jgi:hypothetical protein